MELRDRLRKAAGLFVELPPEEHRAEASGFVPHAEAHTDVPRPARTVEQIVRQSDGPNLDEIQVPHHAAPPTALPDGSTDFGDIYAHAGLPATPFSAEQMRDLLQSLPAELPLNTRRQTVKVTLEAMGKSLGATADTIVADASRKMAALSAYSDALSQQTSTQVAQAQREIAALQAQVEEKRQAAGVAQQNLAQALQAMHAESDKLEDVLEFFSLDVPPSAQAGK